MKQYTSRLVGGLAITLASAAGLFAAQAGQPGSAKIPVADEILQVHSYYDQPVWFVSYDWPGEYPEGFTVSRRGVSVPARHYPDPHDPRTFDCPLPAGANIHPWNGRRSNADNLVFISANEILYLKVSRNGSIEVEGGTNSYQPRYIPVQKNQQIAVLRYFSEGFGQIDIDGVAYTADLAQLGPLTFSSGKQIKEDLWVRLTCYDRHRTYAWVRLDEALKTPGVERSEIREYGLAYDLNY